MSATNTPVWATINEKATLLKAESRWQKLAGLQFVVAIVLAFVVGWGYLAWIIVPIAIFIISCGVSGGSRFSITVLLFWAILSVAATVYTLFSEPSDDAGHQWHDLSEFFYLYVIETGWESFKIAWRRRSKNSKR